MAEGVATLGVGSGVAGLCTLTDLREGVFDFLRDTDRVFITEAMVTKWLNEAYKDLNSRLRLLQASANGTTSATGTFAPPSDFVELISLWFTDVPATIVDDTVFESYSEPAIHSLDNDVVLVRFFAGNFETYPAVVSHNYKLRYVARPANMSNPLDQPTALTPELCVRLRKYALAEAYSREGEDQRSSIVLTEYLEGLPGRPRAGHRMRPAPVSLIPAPGPFG